MWSTPSPSVRCGCVWRRRGAYWMNWGEGPESVRRNRVGAPVPTSGIVFGVRTLHTEMTMRYASFPKIPGLEVSVLGFGAMRLPTVGGDVTRIDYEIATPLLHEAISAGINYVDTAWPYHGGESEMFLGRALHGGWREKVKLATKSPVWAVRSEGDWERIVDAQLKKLDTERIDFYLMHALSGPRWDAVKRLRGMEALERARLDGRIDHVGFSFHGSCDDFKRIVDAYDWEFCQIQLNYLDEAFQAGLEGLRYAAARGIGVIAMEPLRGGALARVPPPVEAIFKHSGKPWSPAEWALRWVWAQPGVVTVLSGMNLQAQLRENLMAASTPAALDMAPLREAEGFYRARAKVNCTTCGYCQPCPSGVSIPETFAAYATATMFDPKAVAAWMYETFVLKNEAGADRCVSCGECEARCPQLIPIAEKLREAHAYLTSR